jgi:hypothetical protein
MIQDDCEHRDHRDLALLSAVTSCGAAPGASESAVGPASESAVVEEGCRALF